MCYTHRYVRCSLSDPTDTQPLLIHTNEESPAYLAAVASGLAHSHGTAAVHFIDAPLHAMFPQDNFLVFAIELAVEQLASQRLVLRPNEAGGCTRCVPAAMRARRPPSFQWEEEFPVPFTAMAEGGGHDGGGGGAADVETEQQQHPRAVVHARNRSNANGGGGGGALRACVHEAIRRIAEG